MEKVNQLLNTVGLERKKLYEWEDFEDYLEYEAEKKVVIDRQNNQESELTEWEIDVLTQQLFNEAAELIISDADKFCQTFGLLYEGKNYPEWMLKGFCFRVRMDDVRENIALEFSRRSEVLEQLFYAVDRNEKFVNTLSAEFYIKRVFHQEEAMEELKEKYIQHISIIKGLFNGNEKIGRLTLELKKVIQKDMMERIKNNARR